MALTVRTFASASVAAALASPRCAKIFRFCSRLHCAYACVTCMMGPTVVNASMDRRQDV